MATLRSWYIDSDGPVAASGLMHLDTSAPGGYNDDSSMDFAWTPGSDPDSGWAQTFRIERISDAATCEHSLTAAQDTLSFGVGSPLSCDAGGTLLGSSMPLDELEGYTVLVVTVNGVDPVVEDPSSADSDVVGPIVQDQSLIPLFADDFETSDLGAWSLVSPSS